MSHWSMDGCSWVTTSSWEWWWTNSNTRQSTVWGRRKIGGTVGFCFWCAVVRFTCLWVTKDRTMLKSSLAEYKWATKYTQLLPGAILWYYWQTYRSHTSWGHPVIGECRELRNSSFSLDTEAWWVRSRHPIALSIDRELDHLISLHTLHSSCLVEDRHQILNVCASQSECINLWELSIRWICWYKFSQLVKRRVHSMHSFSLPTVSLNPFISGFH